MDEIFYFQLSSWLINASTFIVSSALLYSFSKLKRKAFGLYLIFILNVIAVIFSFVSMLGYFVQKDQATAVIFGSLQVALYNFALYWSTSIAIFVYIIMKYKRGFDSNKLMGYGVGGSAAFALTIMILTILEVFGIQIEYFSPGLFSMNQPADDMFNQVMYLVLYDGIGTLLPIIITFYCYLYVFRSIRATYGTAGKTSHVDASRVLWYSGIQMVCFIPAVLMDITSMFVNFDAFAPGLIAFVLHRSWGFFNALAYWFLRTNRMDRGGSLVSENTTAESVASRVEVEH